MVFSRILGEFMLKCLRRLSNFVLYSIERKDRCNEIYT